MRFMDLGLASIHAIDRVAVSVLPGGGRDLIHRAILRTALIATRAVPRIRRRIEGLGSAPPVFRDVPSSLPPWLARETETMRREVDDAIPKPDSLHPNPWHLWHPGRSGPGIAYRKMSVAWPKGSYRLILEDDPEAAAIAIASSPAPEGTIDVILASGCDRKRPTGIPDRAVLLYSTTYTSGLHPSEAALAVARILIQRPPASFRIGSSAIGSLIRDRHAKALGLATANASPES